MQQSHYLQQSKAIYNQLKETLLQETRERAGKFQNQVIDPQKLKPEFRLEIADLHYRLSHYKRLLDAEESILHNSPYEVRAKMEKELLSIYGDKIVALITHHATRIEPLCQDLSPEEHFLYKTYFQEHLLDFVTFCSAFSTRAISKPREYAGDDVMMAMLCDDNVYVGKTLFEKCCHRFSVTSPSGAPVKNRLKVICNVLEESVHDTLQTKDTVRVLDLACGPSIPLQRFMKRPESSHLEIFFLDQDADAIENLQHRLRDLKEQYQRHTHFHFYSRPIQAMLSDPEILSQVAKQDLIICSGLFDYIDDNLSRMLIHVLYSLLNSGGTLLVGNLCPAETTKIFQWYVNEWPLNFRSKEELLALAPEETKAEILAEELGFNLFLKISKD